MGAFGELLKIYWGEPKKDSNRKETIREDIKIQVGDLVKIGSFDVLVEKFENKGFYGIIVKQRYRSKYLTSSYINMCKFFDGFNYEIINTTCKLE